jgi:hypothetical protein
MKQKGLCGTDTPSDAFDLAFKLSSRKQGIKSKGKIEGVGQECPTHT